MNKKIREWNRYPTGGIEKGDYCDKCKKFNNRQVTCGAVLIEDNRAFLVERAIEPNRGYWVVPGGYLGWDETVEEAALRELREETGFEGKVSKLLEIRSDSSAGNQRQNVDLFFEVVRIGGELKHDQEVAQSGWFGLDNLPEKVAFGERELITRWLKETK